MFMYREYFLCRMDNSNCSERDRIREKNRNNSLFSEEEVQPHAQFHSGSVGQNWEWTLNSKFTVQVLIAKLCFRTMYRLNLMSQILTVCSV